MDESADDPMFGDGNYSKDNNDSDIILLGEADDAKNEEIDIPIAVRDELCYSNDIIDTKGAARLVFNINKCVVEEKCSSRIPGCPPDVDSPRSIVYVIPVTSTLKPNDCNIDGLSPWRDAKSNGTTVNYFVEIKDDELVSTKKAVKGTKLEPRHRVLKKYYIKHPRYPGLTKTIFRCDSESGVTLEKDTFVVIMYSLSEATKLHAQVHGNSKRNKDPLIHIPSEIRSLYQQQLKAKKPMEARKEVIQQHGGYATAPADVLLSRKALYNLAQSMKERNVQSTCGRVKEIDFDAIEKFKKQRTIMKEYTDGDVYFTNPHIRKSSDGLPASQFLCAMLSERRDGETYLWMGQQLMKYIGSATKICRALVTDGDRGFDQLHKLPIFDPDFCEHITCKIHKVENLLDRVPEQHRYLAKVHVFGETNPHGIHITGAVDEITKERFDAAIDEMLNLPCFSNDAELKAWFSVAQREYLFKRYGIASRLKAGFGFDTASTQSIECRNKLFKEDINNKKYAVDKLIPLIEEHCFTTMEYLFEALLHSTDFKLSKSKISLKSAPREWEVKEFEDKINVLKKFGYEKWFDHPRNSASKIPSLLLKNLESKQRKNIEQKSIELSQSCLFKKDGTVRAVIDEDPRKRKQNFAILIDLAETPVFCGCSYLEKGLLFCEHVVAGCYAMNDFEPLYRQEIHFQNETAKEALSREYYSNMGTKKNETRRRGASETRQHPQHAIDYYCRKRSFSEVGEPDSHPPVPPKRIQILEEQEDGEIADDNNVMMREPAVHVTSVTTRRTPRVREGDFSTIEPTHRPRRPFDSNVGAVIPEETPLGKFIRERRPLQIPCYWNGNIFTVAKLAEQKNAQKCSCCDAIFNRKSTDLLQSHVVVHLERYEFPKGKETITSKQQRSSYICAKLECVIGRYPYFVKELLTFSPSLVSEERAAFSRNFNI
uniref:SWIM-type domain-containing protein n=1 Tax=Panagrolaimus sp. PS1159 TaxID=55785 RepID=A0AC35F2F3_9BILA